MGPAGTELRVQECREGRLLSRLATRRQEVRHLGRGWGRAQTVSLSEEHGEAEA